MTKINESRGTKDVPNITDFNPLFIGVDLDPRDLNSLIFKKGIRCTIYDVIPCPNIKSIDGREHEINCTLCNGSGYLDENPLDSLVFTQGFSKDLQKQLNQLTTEWEEGILFCTFLSGVNLTYFSKVVLTDYAKPYFEYVQRQGGTSDRVRYPIYQVKVLKDNQGVSYTQGTDFTVDQGMVRWVSGKGPGKGTIYSINYSTAVTYRAISAMHQGRYGTNEVKVPELKIIEFPEQWKLKLDYLITQTRDDGSIIEPNKILFPPGE